MKHKLWWLSKVAGFVLAELWCGLMAIGSVSNGYEILWNEVLVGRQFLGVAFLLATIGWIGIAVWVWDRFAPWNKHPKKGEKA